MEDPTRIHRSTGLDQGLEQQYHVRTGLEVYQLSVVLGRCVECHPRVPLPAVLARLDQYHPYLW